MAEDMTESKLSTTEQVASLWSLGGLSISQLGQKVWRAFNDDFLLDRAAALAFNFILAIFPLLLFLLAILGVFTSRGTELRGNLMQYLSQVLPPAAFQVVSHTLTEVVALGRRVEHIETGLRVADRLAAMEERLAELERRLGA